MNETLFAGAGVADITPTDSQFLCGYPHVERYSTGVHDKLLSSALYLYDGSTHALFVANDIVLFTKAAAQRVRKRIAETTSVPEAHIILSATHTHSGPITVNLINNEADAVGPKADPNYLALLEDGMVEAATKAYNAAEPAELGLAVADGTGVGTNRRDPAGPADPQVPVLLMRTPGEERPRACMVVYSMHPTVMHEDSTLVSADFPGAARKRLQEDVLGPDCPVIYHTGPCGNQSPRHVTRGNTFAEGERLGSLLAARIAQVIPTVEFSSRCVLRCKRALLDLPRRAFSSVAEAEAKHEAVLTRLERMRQDGSSSQDVRTAECDWFGAEENLTLSRAAAEGRLDAAYASCLPGEIQTISVGDWNFVGWPGEIFIEYALELKRRCPNTFVICLSSGELHGYIVTEEAANEGGYEASNALFRPEAGRAMVEETATLLDAD